MADAEGGLGSPPWTEARERGINLRALGQEPGWILEIDRDGDLVLDYDYGRHRLGVPTPAPAPAADGSAYRAATDRGPLEVQIQDTPCRDIMSGARFPLTVEVRLGERLLRGCGARLR